MSLYSRCHAPRGNGEAPKGRDIPAQGSALGRGGWFFSSPEGALHPPRRTYVAPLQGLNYVQNTLPGLRPGLVCYAPLGRVLQKIFSDDSCITMSAERGNEKGRGHVR